MKVGAHPLLVAVALGLLGPSALAAESEDRGGRKPGRCEGCDCERRDPDVCADPELEQGDALSFGLVSGDDLGFVMTDAPDALASEAALLLS